MNFKKLLAIFQKSGHDPKTTREILSIPVVLFRFVLLLLLDAVTSSISPVLPLRMAVPTVAADAVLVQSVQMPKDSIKIEGYDFNKVGNRRHCAHSSVHVALIRLCAGC